MGDFRVLSISIILKSGTSKISRRHHAYVLRHYDLNSYKRRLKKRSIMRKSKFIPILLSGVFVLAACAQAATPAPPPTSPPEETVEAAQPAETEAPTLTEAVEATLPSEEATSTGAPSYAADVQPIFAQYCFACHSGEGATKGVRLDGYDYALAGGGSGPVIIPNDPSGSELLKRITGDSVPRMPRNGPPFLTDQEIQIITSWIAAGAPDN
jgi:mono/diheme cytochrome c family protein